MTVHLFGATSSPSCCLFCLKQVAVWFGSCCSPEVLEAIERSFYMDDCLISVATTQKAIDLVVHMRDMLSKCAFQLTNWIIPKEVIDSVPEEHRSKVSKLHSFEGDLSERVLGVNWNLVRD